MKDITDLISERETAFADEFPDISELGDGVYRAKWYGWVFELADGRKFRPRLGIKCNRWAAGWEDYMVEGGEITKVS